MDTLRPSVYKLGAVQFNNHVGELYFVLGLHRAGLAAEAGAQRRDERGLNEWLMSG